MSTRVIYVYADWKEINGPILMGELRSDLTRGKEVFSFEYNPEWLKSGFSQILDPDLQLYTGPQYLGDEGKGNFGVFLDSSPDRWGRVLMKRKEAAHARKEGRAAKKLFEQDYLLGVYDGHRMGGLRFKEDIEGPFLNNDSRHAAPPWTSIRELEEISLKLESDDSADDPDYLQWLNMIINPGSSLGGARPKASVIDAQGELWIAKFPSKNDEGDVGIWEYLAYKLAISSGISMGECLARKFSSDHHTFLAKRFDRSPNSARLHFCSAMTQLGYSDGADSSIGASYLDIAEFLTENGAKVTEDLNELWRRIVFSICVSNTDDHLRNHGFLLTNKGWILSPAYDINPIENSSGLKLNINEDDNSLDLELAMEVHEYFRLNKKEAENIISKVVRTVKKWREVADKYGISRNQQDLKATAFQVVN